MDYVFLSATRFTWKDADVAFDGTSGAVQLRGAGKPVLALGSGGRIEARGEVLASETPATTASANVPPNGATAP